MLSVDRKELILDYNGLVQDHSISSALTMEMYCSLAFRNQYVVESYLPAITVLYTPSAVTLSTSSMLRNMFLANLQSL